MNKFILDVSVTMSWCFADENNTYSRKVLESFAVSSAVVPALWLYEITNVLLVAESSKRLTANDSSRYLNLLFQLPIEIDDFTANATEILRLGREFKLSSYGASYLELAIRHGSSLATLDKDLKRSCKKLNVPLFFDE